MKDGISIQQLQDYAQRKDHHFDLSFQKLTKSIQYSPAKKFNLLDFSTRILNTGVACIVSQVPEALRNLTRQSYLSAFHRGYIGFEWSFLTLGMNVSIDHIDLALSLYRTEYQKGGLTGLLSYLIYRPLGQLAIAQQHIFEAQRKKVGRMEALRAVLRQDGLKGLYKHENLLAPLSSIAHRAIYFGLYHKIINKIPQPNHLLELGAVPLTASLAATVATFIPEKLRRQYMAIHNEREAALVRRRKVEIKLGSPSEEVIKALSQGKITVSMADFRWASQVVLKNWLLLSCFTLSQSRYFGVNE